MSSKFEQPSQRIEVPLKCSNEEVAALIEKYGAYGLREKDEYFYIEYPEERKTTFLHKFKKFPQKRADGTMDYEDIETHLRALLQIEEGKEDEN